MHWLNELSIMVTLINEQQFNVAGGGGEAMYVTAICNSTARVNNRNHCLIVFLLNFTVSFLVNKQKLCSHLVSMETQCVYPLGLMAMWKYI